MKPPEMGMDMPERKTPKTQDQKMKMGVGDQKKPEEEDEKEKKEQVYIEGKEFIDAPYLEPYHPKNDQEEKEIFLEALRQNPLSCAGDSWIVVGKENPKGGCIAFVSKAGMYPKEDAKGLAILGYSEDLFAKYKDDVDKFYDNLSKKKD